MRIDLKTPPAGRPLQEPGAERHRRAAAARAARRRTACRVRTAFMNCGCAEKCPLTLSARSSSCGHARRLHPGVAADALYRLAAHATRRAEFRASAKGRSNIYLVLLDFSDRDGSYGVYVGMSKYSPAQRFDQHKAGIRAAGSVLKRGVEVLTGPTMHLQYIKRAKRRASRRSWRGARRWRGCCWSRGGIDDTHRHVRFAFCTARCGQHEFAEDAVRAPQLVGGQGLRTDSPIQPARAGTRHWFSPTARP